MKNGRGERIRTSDPLLPKQVLYQAEPRPDFPSNSVECVPGRRPGGLSSLFDFSIAAAGCKGKRGFLHCVRRGGLRSK